MSDVTFRNDALRKKGSSIGNGVAHAAKHPESCYVHKSNKGLRVNGKVYDQCLVFRVRENVIQLVFDMNTSVLLSLVQIEEEFDRNVHNVMKLDSGDTIEAVSADEFGYMFNRAERLPITGKSGGGSPMYPADYYKVVKPSPLEDVVMANHAERQRRMADDNIH